MGGLRGVQHVPKYHSTPSDKRDKIDGCLKHGGGEHNDVLDFSFFVSLKDYKSCKTGVMETRE